MALSASASAGHAELRAVFADLVHPDAGDTKKRTFWEVITNALAKVAGKPIHTFDTAVGASTSEPLPDCGMNLSCNIYNFVEWQIPLQDGDGDWFAPQGAKRFRGTDWRGYDCNDEVCTISLYRYSVIDIDKHIVTYHKLVYYSIV
jgi:hypothetical protein